MIFIIIIILLFQSLPYSETLEKNFMNIRRQPNKYFSQTDRSSNLHNLTRKGKLPSVIMLY